MLDRASSADNATPEASGLLSSSLQPGGVIHGKYKVERVIGEGGMGVVVAARHMTLDRNVAIKLLNTKARGSAEALERFTREARAAAKIQSEHVGRVLDVDTLPNGAPFIVMELLEGHDLAVELRAKAALPVAEAVSIILQASEAIAEAHAGGIVHRDLKPANLFLSKTPSGQSSVKVLDFGISKITRREDSGATTDDKALTNAGSMLGSPLYMSPEQMQASGQVDKRTDIWSLGVILYELVTGRSPFDGKTIPIICAQVLASPTPPLDLPGAPDGLEAVIMRSLAKDPAKRYRDVAHFVRALAPFAPEQAAITLEWCSRLKDDSGQVAATPATIPPPGFAKEGGLTITSWNAKPDAAPRRRWLPLAFAGVGSLVVLGFALQSALSGDSAPTGASNAAATAEPGATSGRGAEVVVTATAVEPASATSLPGATSTPSAVASDAASASASEAATASASAKPTSPAGPRTWKPSGPKTSKTAGFGGRE